MTITGGVGVIGIISVGVGGGVVVGLGLGFTWVRGVGEAEAVGVGSAIGETDGSVNRVPCACTVNDCEIVWSMPEISGDVMVILWFPGARGVSGLNDQFPYWSAKTAVAITCSDSMTISTEVSGKALPLKSGWLS